MIYSSDYVNGFLFFPCALVSGFYGFDFFGHVLDVIFHALQISDTSGRIQFSSLKSIRLTNLLSLRLEDNGRIGRA